MAPTNPSATQVSIVSPKVQTTKERMLGVITEGDTQLVRARSMLACDCDTRLVDVELTAAQVMLDTPGILSFHDGRKCDLDRTEYTFHRHAGSTPRGR